MPIRDRLLAAALGLAAAHPASAATFTPLGDLPGGSFESSAYGISADGATVVGQSHGSSGNEAFLWTAGGGMTGLGDLPGGAFESTAWAASADGSVVVGSGTDSFGNEEAFRWTSGGMVGLGNLGGAPFFSRARDVSADGSVVVGRSRGTSGNVAFRWTSATGMLSLESLPGGSTSSQANAVSADGSTIVGSGGAAAYAWTVSTGVPLGDLPGGLVLSVAQDASSDGSTIVGVSDSTGSSGSGFFEGFLWTSGDGMLGLGDLPGGVFSSNTRAVSADGSIVVGSSTTTSGRRAFLWDAQNGMRDLQLVLESSGLDLTGWTLTEASGISADGSLIAGTGVNPSAQTEAWIALVETTPIVPALGPSGGAAIALAVLVFGAHAARRPRPAGRPSA